MTITDRNLLSVRDLVVRYPAGSRSRASLTAVRGVDLDIPPAGIYGLVGESGSGKSSLAHAILQLQPVAAGQALLHGQDLVSMKGTQLRSARKKIQLVFQDPLASLSPRRSILQTLRRTTEPLRNWAAPQGAKSRHQPRWRPSGSAPTSGTVTRGNCPADNASGSRWRAP